MRRSITEHVTMRRLALVTLALAAALAAAAPLRADGDGLSLALSTTAATYGDRVVASGQLQPAAAGDAVVLELAGPDGVRQLASGTVDAAGTYVVEFEAVAGGAVQARAPGSGAASEPVALTVVPKVSVEAGKGRAFLGATVTVRVRPVSYHGRVLAHVSSGPALVGSAVKRVRRGVARLHVPTPGAGRFVVALSLPASDGLAGTTLTSVVSATGRTLSLGTSGADVVGFAQRLAELRFRVPPPSTTFGYELLDSVYAFEKAYGLPRTGVVDGAAWRRLARAKPLRPRYAGPAAHIEVDKTRQILLDVRGGEVAAILPVSTGATGNTPEGRHQIRWKALATTTWLGPAILYRTMTFYGNSFAIHGFSPVPPYPASHGCVRIPIWAADWLYQRSSVGETVYVYR
jgi:hypothetical protein